MVPVYIGEIKSENVRLFDTNDYELVGEPRKSEIIIGYEWELVMVDVYKESDVLVFMKDGFELNASSNEIEFKEVGANAPIYAVQQRMYSEYWVETCECCGPEPVIEEYGNNTLFLSHNIYAALEYAKSIDENEIYFDDILISIVYLDEEIDNGGTLNG